MYHGALPYQCFGEPHCLHCENKSTRLWPDTDIHSTGYYGSGQLRIVKDACLAKWKVDPNISSFQGQISHLLWTSGITTDDRDSKKDFIKVISFGLSSVHDLILQGIHYRNV
jgi:hypothetical protein